ncbi:type VI secretion system baseplate subunit TssE [Undibacterium sp.]|uniref:type VI secretion system baseplate subunit TssE n=1 Tax=Undibacterium sp. TaxID=1914977 RepID=UPI00374CCE2C
MQGFAPGLLDKLMGDSRHTSSGDTVTRLSMEDLKDAVARDLEALLNTRKIIPEGLLTSYPECSKSIATYGLSDFAGLSLASTDDRAFICRSLEQTIARHEPRLRNVKAALEVQEGSINRLNFAISALLVVHPAQEPVSFDAVLQPSSLHYSISKTRRAARAGMTHG